MRSELMRGGEFAEEHHCVDLAQLIGVLAHKVTQAFFCVDQFETLRMPHSADFWMLMRKLLSRQIP
ncbi:hypothetical protein AN416_39295 (plasmid) [Paraburkholderia caribensis]|nr:hypothetical protein AN416_39295 [Paraburkholderia caribensis]